MMKHCSIALFVAVLAACILSITGLQAQQMPQFSQYMMNPYVINPAASSMYRDIDLNMGFRQQWAGFEGAPRTYYMGGTVNLGRRDATQGFMNSIPISHRGPLTEAQSRRRAKHVLGGLAAVDEYGLFQRSSVMLSYAYHQPIGDSYYLAVGTSMGWYGMNFGANQVVLENPVDNVYNDFVARGTRANLFDINAGVMLYGDRAFVGYSVYQIGENQIELGNQTSPAGLADTRLAVHQFFLAGYRFSLSESVDLTPSAAVKLRSPAPASFDINLRLDYRNSVFGGLSYRYEDAVSLLAGYRINDAFWVAWAYDYVTSSINNLSSGSHEIVLGFQMNRK